MSAEKEVWVKLSCETVEFLTELGKRINAQDNRATARPYFFVLQTEKWRVAHGEYHAGDTKQVFVDVSGDSDREYQSRAEALKYLTEVCGFDEAEAEKLFERDFEEFTMERYEEEDNCFLTEHGVREHIRLNGHNLGRRGKSYRDYLKHAFRNPEMDGLFKALAEFATVKEML